MARKRFYLTCGLAAVCATALIQSTASAAVMAAYEEEAVNGAPHVGTIQASTTDLLAGLNPTGIDQGWAGITNTFLQERLTDGSIDTSTDGADRSYIGGEPSASNFVQYSLGGAFDIDSVALIGSWGDRTGQAWTLSFSTDNGANFSTVFTLNGLDDDGLVTGFTDNVVNRVTVFEEFGALGTGVTDVRIDFGQDDVSWNVYREIDVIEVPEPASLALVGLGGLAILARRRARAYRGSSL